MKIRHFVAAALLSAAPVFAETWRLNPGSGVGPISLGAGYLQANAVLTPKEALVTKAGALLRYKEEIDLECENKKITQIVLHKTSFQGKSGPIDVVVQGNLKIGSSVSQMETALGRSYESHSIPVAKKEPPVTYYAYRSLGLGLISKGGKIIEFSVWPRK